MTTAEGRFRTIHGGVPHCAIVEVRVTDSSKSNIEVECNGKGWERQGSLEDASESGYTDWKMGARRGAEFALQIANSTSDVTIKRITGMITDTNPSTVCGATVFAVWNALEFVPDEKTVTTLESVVVLGWKRQNDDIPTMDELCGDA